MFKEMGTLREALWGFADREVERRYLAHLQDLIKPWLMQACTGPILASIALFQAKAAHELSGWEAFLPPLATLVIFCSVSSTISGRGCPACFPFSLVTAIFCCLRLVVAFGSPLLETFLISGQ